MSFSLTTGRTRTPATVTHMFVDADLADAIAAYATHRDAVYADEDAGHQISPDQWIDLGDEARAIVDALTSGVSPTGDLG